VPVSSGGCCEPSALAGGDHFAPKYLVGNVLAGDSAVPQVGAFRYIPDPGDGTGIALALAEAIASPGDVMIRRGTYTKAAGQLRFAVPAGVRVYGAGSSTVIIGSNADNCIFALAAGASVDTMALRHPGTAIGVGVGVVEMLAADVEATRLRISIVVARAIRAIYASGGATTVSPTIEDNVIGTGFSPVITVGAAAEVVQDARVANNRIASAAAVVPVAIGAGADNTQVQGNTSRGSGATLPTDLGAGSNIANNIWGA